MVRLVLQRRPFEPGEPTLGSFAFEATTPDDRINTHQFDQLPIKCLELPWLDNATGKSCIPPSEDYRLVWTKSNRFSKLKGRDVYMWEVQNVKGRAGIRIHSGNYAGVKLSDSLGCPLPCMEWSDINKDGDMDGVRSKEAMEMLLKLLEPYKSNGLAFSVRNAA